jgi:hypothetical protein
VTRTLWEKNDELYHAARCERGHWRRARFAGNPITRRTIFIGAAASLIYAPAIVRPARLMPLRHVFVP